MTSGNAAVTTFDVTIADTQAPFFSTVPTSPVAVAVGAGGTGSLNFEDQVVAADVDGVDPDPAVSCATGAGAVSGDPLSLGDHVVTCDATDASGNMAQASYTARAQCGSSFGISI